MAYVTTTPQATDAINATQPVIQNNFAVLQTAFSVNHTPLSDAPGQGYHNFLTLPEQGAAPATQPDQGALYTAVGATSGQTELCFRREDSVGVGGAIIPFTEYGTPAANHGWTYLPSGILVKWGYGDSMGGLESITINWGPNYTNVFTGFALVTTKYTIPTTNGFAAFYDISNLPQPVLRIQCGSINNLATPTQTYFSYLVMGV